MSQGRQSPNKRQNGHNTSSSLSSGGTSSMETVPMSDFVDGDFEDEEVDIVWGRLFPLGKAFHPLGM